METAGIGADGGEKAIGNGRGDGPLGLFEEAIDEFAATGGLSVDPVDFAVAGIGAVMIDVDEWAAFADGIANGTHAFEVGAVDHHRGIKGSRSARAREDFAWV